LCQIYEYVKTNDQIVIIERSCSSIKHNFLSTYSFNAIIDPNAGIIILLLFGGLLSVVDLNSYTETSIPIHYYR